ncbi:copper chaperone PCu(A)C [Paraferrimonas sp. SM1919]|uniref:copper chaperone PCu(A)C n=1 Tax=Paraferrimonas sp. SM1919 TaxID=2662263 RepID=UPI0013D5DA35|nr:copper chaperone PCu(A)C [Paraferrimonas sp. SM1919]
MKLIFKQLFNICLLSLVSFVALAEGITVTKAYSNAMPKSVPNGAAYMRINNHTATDITLESAVADIAKVEIHTMVSHDGLMSMEQLEAIGIAANSSFELKPGGVHLMLLGLKKPLIAGESFDVRLKFNNGQTLLVNVEIAQSMQHHHGHH